MKVLPLVFFAVLTVMTSVHGRAILRLRRSSLYYANETACVVDDVAYYNGDPVPSSDPCEECKCRTPGFVCTIKECEEKDGCQRIKVQGECCSYECGSSEEVSREDVKDVPITTTLFPTSVVSDVKEKDHEHSHQDHDHHAHLVHPHAEGEAHTHDAKEEEKDDSGAAKKEEHDDHVSSSEKPVESDAKSEEEQEKPVEQPKSDEHGQKASKRSEPTSVPFSHFSSQESASDENLSVATKEPESSTKQEPDDSDKKLEAVTEPRKEGRSSSAEPQSEVTSPASEDHSSVSPQEPQKPSEEKLEDSVKKEDHVSHHVGHSSGAVSGSFEKRHSLEEHEEPASESPKFEKEPVTEPVAVKVGEEFFRPAKDAAPAEVSSEESRDGFISVVVVSTTPEADKQEAREGVVLAFNEKSEEKQQDATSQVPPKDHQEGQTTAAPSDSPAEEAKEVEKEVPPIKSGPSKRFADWVDYVPRDFQG